MVSSYFANKPATSRYEFWWALGHPFAAIKVKRIHKKLAPYYNEAELKLKLDGFSSGGKLDAFRHVFYMAAFGQKVKAKKLIKLGKAHERTNYLQFKRNKDEHGLVPDSISCVMDLLNNEIGVKLGRENKKMSYEELKQKVIGLVNEGNAHFLAIDKYGNYLDCNNQVIDLKAYKGKWYIPKCILGFKAQMEMERK
jgi:hypothetical protein